MTTTMRPGADAKSANETLFIDGEAGTTGLEIRERLARVRGVTFKSIATKQKKDPAARKEMMASVDLVVLCLPDDAAREAVALADELGEEAPRILDASTAHRVAEGWVYGFAELDKDQTAAIAGAKRVANPGCYATGAIALIRPLVDAGIFPPDYPLTINAVSGYSGGGRTMIEAYVAKKAPAFDLYALGLEHKHLPEIERYGKITRRPVVRSVRRQFPPGHAGQHSALPRRASWKAERGRHRGGAGPPLCEVRARSRSSVEKRTGRPARDGSTPRR